METAVAIAVLYMPLHFSIMDVLSAEQHTTHVLSIHLHILSECQKNDLYFYNDVRHTQQAHFLALFDTFVL